MLFDCFEYVSYTYIFNHVYMCLQDASDRDMGWLENAPATLTGRNFQAEDTIHELYLDQGVFKYDDKRRVGYVWSKEFPESERGSRRFVLSFCAAIIHIGIAFFGLALGADVNRTGTGWIVSIWKKMTINGCFLKWWYPQNTPKWSFLVGKPMKSKENIC